MGRWNTATHGTDSSAEQSLEAERRREWRQTRLVADRSDERGVAEPSASLTGGDEDAADRVGQPREGKTCTNARENGRASARTGSRIITSPLRQDTVEAAQELRRLWQQAGNMPLGVDPGRSVRRLRTPNAGGSSSSRREEPGRRLVTPRRSAARCAHLDLGSTGGRRECAWRNDGVGSPSREVTRWENEARFGLLEMAERLSGEAPTHRELSLVDEA